LYETGRFSIFDDKQVSCIFGLSHSGYWCCGLNITPNCSVNGQYGIPVNEDWLKYWDTSANICFGRYLEFASVNNEAGPIPFWLGLDSTPWETRYIIWFEKIHLTATSLDNLKKTFDPFNQYEKSVKEVWIILDNTIWENFCKSASPPQRIDIIKDFLVRVLGVL
jgi:hypothetical protein